MVSRVAQQRISTKSKVIPATLILLLGLSIAMNIQLYRQAGEWMKSTHKARFEAHDAIDSRNDLWDRCTGMTGL